MEDHNKSSHRSISVKEMSPLLMAIAIDIMGFGLVFPVLTAMLTSSESIIPNASHSYRAMLLGFGYFLYPFFMLFGASFLGDLSDNWGRKKTLNACMLGICISFFLMAFGVFVNILTIFMVGRALSGLMAGSQPIAQATIADLSHGPAKAKNMGILAFVNSISLMIAPLLGGVLSDSKVVPFFGYWTPFLFASLLGLGTFFWVQFAFKETFSPKKHSLDLLRPIRIFREALAMKNIRLLCVVLIVMQIGIALYFQYMVIYLSDTFRYSTFVIGLFYGYLGIFFSVSLLVLVPIFVKKYTYEKLVFWSLLLTGVFFLSSLLYRSEVFIWVLAACIGLTNNIAFALLITTFSNQVSRERQGWVMGIYGSSIAVAFTISGLTAFLLPYLSTLGLLTIGALCYFVSCLIMGIFNKTHTLYGPKGPIYKSHS